MITGIILMLLIIAAVLFPRSRTLTILIALFMVFMYSHAYYEGDLQVYEWLYNSPGDGSFEKGYELLVLCCNKIGLNFFQFRLLLSCVYVTFTVLAVRKFTEYKALAMAVLSIFPLFVFVSVLRSGIACAIILFSISFLISDSRFGTVVYLIGVLVATSMHISAIVFILLIFAKKRISLNKLLVLAPIIFALCYLYVYTDAIYNIVTSVISSEKITAWFVQPTVDKNIKGITADAVILIANVIFAKYGRDACITQQGLETISKSRQELANIAFNSSIFLFMIFPIVNIAGPVIRLAYTMFSVGVCVFLNGSYDGISRFKGEKFGRIPYALIGLVLMLVMWSLYYDFPYLAAGGSAYGNLYSLVLAT